MRKRSKSRSKGLEKLKQIRDAELSRERQALIEGGKERGRKSLWERVSKTCGGIIKQ